jgi:hypothetical protein
MPAYRYAPRVLQALAAHGVQPTSVTPPAQVRQFVNDLYVYELRRLRAWLLEGRVPKSAYAARVLAVRKRYWLLSLPLAEWLQSDQA